MSITENAFWINNKQGLEFKYADYEGKKGLVNEKTPIIKNEKNDCYMRACIRIVDEDGNPVTNESRLEKILGNIWFDTTGENIPVKDAMGTSSYTKKQLQKMQGAGAIDATYNTSCFEEGVWNDGLKAYTFNYKGIFPKEATATLFNRVVYPTDMNNDDWMAVQGEYYIVVWAQAIQATGFNDAESALANLCNAYVPTDVSAYGEGA